MSLSNLVTVYCDRDWAQFCLQVESLRNVVEPVTHWVIVNEPADGIDSYTARITALYQGLAHTVRVLPRPGIINNVGWDNQQYYKLWIWTLIQDSYLVLDCKNFFIRSCTLDAWQGVLGSGTYDNYLKETNSFRATLHYYCQHMGLPVEAYHMGCQTPFLMEHRVMQTVDLDFFRQSISKVMPSEFLYYSLCYRQLYGEYHKPVVHLTRNIWPEEKVERLKSEMSHPYLVFAFHRRWLSADPAQAALANRALADWGFESRL